MAIIAFDPQIPVFDRYAKSFPQHPEGEPATYGPFSEACSTQFEWDAHFTAYSCPTIARRLGKTPALAFKPKMVLFVLDIDGPDHKCTPEWWALEKEKVRAFFKAHGRGYCYTTRGGYRLVLGLRDELVLDTPATALRWRYSYLDWIASLQRDFQIVCDPQCADWTRCYRLPRVSRDGIPTTPVDEVGEPDRMLEWRGAYVAADDPRVLRTDIIIEVSEPAPVDEDRQIEAVRALAEMWPTRNRHYAGLALCGALARAGWSEGAIIDFACAVFGTARTIGEPWFEEAQASARSSLEKVARGEAVAGWDTLAQYLSSDLHGQFDETRRAAVDEYVLTARRAIGQGPAIDLFDTARATTKPVNATNTAAGAMKLLAESLASSSPVSTLPAPDVDRSQQLDAACAEMNGDQAYREMLDEAATKLEPLIAQAEAKGKTVDARPMGMTYREIRARNQPPPDYLVQYLITREGVGALSGEPKSGKSWDATHIAVAVAAGTASVFGKFAVQHAAGVFYFYAEDTESSVNNRIAAIATGMGLEVGGEWVDRLVAQPRGRPLDIMSLADLCVLVASVWRFERRGSKFALVVLDPLSNIHSGEEDKRDSMVKVMARLHAVEQILGCAILFVHHSGKTSAENKGRKRGGQKMRGSSAIHGAVDFGIYVNEARGDGKNEFIGRIESEVKAARGGGVFDRTIKIDDNAQGNAVKVVHTWAEPTAETAEPNDLAEQRAKDVVQKLFDQNAPLTFAALKAKIKGKTDLLMRAIHIAEEEGWVANKTHGGRSCGFEITEKGRDLIRSGGSGGGEDDEDTPPAPPVPPTDIGFQIASYISTNT